MQGCTMAREGRFVWACAVAAVVPGLLWAGPEEDRDNAVSAALAVQTALQQGRDHLLRGDARSAVFVLESQLARINGNPAYLALLRDAYRAYLKELRLANQAEAIQLYTQRLQILDPGAVLDGSTARGASSPPAVAAPPAPKANAAAAAPSPAAAPKAKTAPAPAATAPRSEPTVRGSREDDDSFHKRRADEARGLLARAEEEFRHQRYREAYELYEKANQCDPSCLAPARERWAYCKLHRVVERINQPAAETVAWAELDREVRQALELAPRLDYGQKLLAEIEQRRLASSQSIAVRHFERGSDAWARAESANFRILHNQPRELAEQVARVAERTRSAMGMKWFGRVEADWNPRCDIYLHVTAEDYSKATGVPANSPGHSTIRSDAGRVVGRRIDLHVDEPNLLTAILPHEATHTVIAGQFGDKPVPRWADEGIAVLTEPRDRVERHLRNLPRCQQENQLFPVRQLMQLHDYPQPRAISAFYAQSVSLVEFLTNVKGPQVFAQFLRDALQTNYEQALERHYGYRGFDDLQQRWSQHALAGNGGGVAQRNR
jgi:hypothetical protein